MTFENSQSIEQTQMLGLSTRQKHKISWHHDLLKVISCLCNENKNLIRWNSFVDTIVEQAATTTISRLFTQYFPMNWEYFPSMFFSIQNSKAYNEKSFYSQ